MGGNGGVIKLNVFRQNALTDQRRRQNRVGNVWLQGFYKFGKGKGAGRALLGSGGRELRATVFAERLPFVPCVLQSFQSLELELAEISSLLSSSGQIEWQSSQGISIWTEEQRKPALSPVVVVWCAANRSDPKFQTFNTAAWGVVIGLSCAHPPSPDVVCSNSYKKVYHRRLGGVHWHFRVDEQSW